MLAALHRISIRWFLLGMVLSMGIDHRSANALEAGTREETWCVIHLGGQRIGYCQSVIETVKQDTQTLVKTLTVTDMTIKRIGEPLVLKQNLTTEETLDGDLLRFRWEMANPPAAVKITSGSVENDQLILTQQINRREKKTTEPWKAGVKSSVFQDRDLKEHPLKPGESRTYETFNPELSKIDKVTLKGHDHENVKLLNNASARLFKVTSTQTLLPGIVTVNYLDKDGDTVKVSQDMAGVTLEMFRVTKADALKNVETGNFDLAVSTLIKVKPIPQSHRSKRVVYRATLSGQNPADVIPTGDTQSIKKINDEAVELTVISLPIPSPAKITSVGDEFLESSQYLQKDDARVQDHALRAAGDATDPGEIARRMESYVQRKLVNKNLATAMASAAEVAQTLEGDCTEHAMLLAAMLRVKGIPSRIVVGLLYVDRESAFGGHMWTEANLNGKWVPLDGTLGAGGIGAAHIKLSDSSLSDNGPVVFTGLAPLLSVIGKLKLDLISSE